MNSKTIENTFKRWLPSPFSIAILLTLITLILTLTFGDFKGEDAQIVLAFKAWKSGLWNSGLMRFLVQMMLMLILGHVLALSPIAEKSIQYFLKYIKSSRDAIWFISVFSIALGLFNWGLGLIFSAIFAQKIGQHAIKNNIKVNYSLIVATAYSSLMVWHGGISGSAPAKVAETNHLKELLKGSISQEKLQHFPEYIDYSQTIFSTMNIIVMLALLIIIPIAVQFLNKKLPQSLPPKHILIEEQEPMVPKLLIGAEKIDYSKGFIKTIGVFVLIISMLDIFYWSPTILRSINPDGINLFLLGLSLFCHKNIQSFLLACGKAIGGGTGILIQFPLYFGIMALMNQSGVVQQMSNVFVSISNQTTFPIFTFISAGIVNIFVPSGGGQWGVQGPIIMQAAEYIGVGYGKTIMALAYGDQLTNMLQPFWALPLLGVTKLKAVDILPYTLYLFIIGGIIFGLSLLIF